MEKLPLGERPFQAKHERARCGKAQRIALERRACWRRWTTRAAVSAKLLRSLRGRWEVLSPRWGLCSAFTGARLLVCCVHRSGRWVCFGCGLLCTWTTAPWQPAAWHAIPAAAAWRKGTHKQSAMFFNFLWPLKASANEKNSQAWEEQSIQASARHRPGKGKHYALTCSRWSSASSKDLTRSSLNTSPCSLNLFFVFC